jgi:hypothetical protein
MIPLELVNKIIMMSRPTYPFTLDIKERGNHNDFLFEIFDLQLINSGFSRQYIFKNY